MTTTHTPRRTTGHPAKDSGGGMTDEVLWSWSNKPPVDWTYAEFVMQERWFAFFAGDGPLPIPPDDYARHRDLEGPR